MRVLLVNPKFPESFWSFRWALDRVLVDKRALNPPLGLATVAALCPQHWEVEIVDENIESVPLDPHADIVGVCGMGVQFARQKELLAFYKSRGYHVVAGGSYASLCPELYESLAHTVVAGEAEYIWPQFCRDFEAGRPQSLYRETGVVSLADSPVPRFELLQLSKYQKVSLQFSRGCPFRCEFCDIIVMFGRKPRTKSVEQIRAELDLLRELDQNSIFFVDDNLIGDKPAAKRLLRFLRSYQEEHQYHFRLGTEASLNLAQDKELLELFRAANFEWVFIGIESPDEASLKETRKFQNTRQDMLSSVQRIHSCGIEVFAGFIIGFDNDTTEVFEKQYQFIMQSGIQVAMVGLLIAVPKTPLYERLAREGRLLHGWNSADNTKLGANIIPMRMTYDEMVDGYRSLQDRLLHHGSIARRIRNKYRHLRKPVARHGYSLRQQLGILRRLWMIGLTPGGVMRLFHFLRCLPLTRPRLLPLAVQDWIVGLSMRDYFDRHYARAAGTVGDRARKRLAKMQAAFRQYVRRGALQVVIDETKDTAATVSVSLTGWVDRRFFSRAGRQFERFLATTTSSITLRIDAFHETQQRYLQRLLKRLARYGDRIQIAVPEELRNMITIDSSIFNVVLECPTGRE
jgi:radical SAM superfamily enzyme YgiQ (UPF0313 family)